MDMEKDNVTTSEQDSSKTSSSILTSDVVKKITESLDQDPRAATTDNTHSNETKVTTKRVPKIDDFGYAYATGKRKNAIARVWVKPGQGKIELNKTRQLKEYFQKETILKSIYKPLILTKSENFDIRTTVKGGGLVGQAEALMYGIAKALTVYDPNLRPLLKRAHLLTRDDRIVERKKYGRVKARKRFQFSKR